jgi:Ca-activated chloride channel homolog
MRRYLPVLAVLLAWAGTVQAHGLLIPEDKTLPPLAMLNHKVSITIEDQVAITRVEQTFRNHTDRNLEATYIFPVPKGANVNKFTMWVNGKETHGELLEADKARAIYTSFVRRTKDPGLLEYIGNDLLQMKVSPIGPKSDQKVALSSPARSSRSTGCRTSTARRT